MFYNILSPLIGIIVFLFVYLNVVNVFSVHNMQNPNLIWFRNDGQNTVNLGKTT